MEFRDLGSYVEDLRVGGEARILTHLRSPVLIAHAIDEGANAPMVGDTEFMSRGIVQLALAANDPSTTHAIVAEQVLPVKKRLGGAFPDRIGVGRSDNVDLRIPLAQISKYHAYFSMTWDGLWQITDAGSTNGTFVGDLRLGKLEHTTLEEGSIVALGPYRFSFHTKDGFVELLRGRAATA